MSNSYMELVSLGIEAEKLSAEIFKLCAEVNKIYDSVFTVYEDLGVIQSLISEQPEMMCSSYQVPDTLRVDLEKIIASMLALEKSMKARLACYGLQLDLIRSKVENLNLIQHEFSTLESSTALKSKLLSSLDFVCERVALLLRAERF
ncbi:hypothetical protein [Pseudomonas quasicaspiana]|uniref:hypothetical protein n=1 Tax=Pseudomonas quasicaspiana TaxID=2829821 RepID=UPI001E502052|nr:hypothetical protein [Pseudomonas quasicaspiana]MCD5972977.1 hypothetical protein [Pseudomonas quasicaspiana]